VFLCTGGIVKIQQNPSKLKGVRVSIFPK